MTHVGSQRPQQKNKKWNFIASINTSQTNMQHFSIHLGSTLDEYLENCRQKDPDSEVCCKVFSCVQ